MFITQSIIEDPNPFNYHSSEDKSLDMYQMRLTLYISALIYYFFPSVDMLRLFSSIIASGIIILVFYFGKELYNEKVGILASFLLAISVYHISFSRFAMSTGDNLFVFFYLLSSYFLYKSINTGTLIQMFLSGIALGLAIASKLFGIILLLIALSYLISQKIRKFTVQTNNKITIVLGIFVLFSFYLNIAFPESYMKPKLYIFFFSLILLATYSFILFNVGINITSKFLVVYHFIVIVMGYALAFSPTHNSIFAIIETFDWISEWNLAPIVHFNFFSYFEILVIRLHTPIILLSIIGLIITYKNPRKENIFLVISCLIPLALLSTIIGKITWYPIFIVPFIYLLASKTIFDVHQLFHKHSNKYIIIVFIVSLITIIEVKSLLETHPYYELDGYQLGKNKMGWDKPSFLSTEKFRDLAEYLALNVEKDSKIGFAFIDYGLFDQYALEYLFYYLPVNYYRFNILNSSSSIENYDYLVLHFYTVQTIIPIKCNLEQKISFRTIDIFYIYNCKKQK